MQYNVRKQLICLHFDYIVSCNQVVNFEIVHNICINNYDVSWLTIGDGWLIPH